jgi:hypothetical protein
MVAVLLRASDVDKEYSYVRKLQQWDFNLLLLDARLPDIIELFFG